jgi:hypothetical protein
VIGFSQTAQWYQGRAETDGQSATGEPRGFEAIVDNNHWQLLAKGGAGVEEWSNPDFEGWSRSVVSPCAERTASPDRALLTISGDTGSGPGSEQVWADEIDRAVTTITTKFPEVRQVILQPVVGGPDDSLCISPEGRRVRASANHPVIDQAIAIVIQNPSVAVEVIAGLSPTVTGCTDYRDSQGHLTDTANDVVGRIIGRFYLDF